MISNDLSDALELPSTALVQKRVAKRLLLENGAKTSADKKRINDGIEELSWVAALKPTTIGVKEYKDESREYLEIAILHLSLRPKAKSPRLVDLVHRAVPYPVVLFTEQLGAIELSAAHKRWAQNETGKTVLDGGIIVAQQLAMNNDEHWDFFRQALSLARQPRSTLHALYQGWIDTMLTLQVARLTNQWNPAENLRHSAVRRAALQECERLESEITRLRAAADREKQLARQVELNTDLKRVEQALAITHSRL